MSRRGLHGVRHIARIVLACAMGVALTPASGEPFTPASDADIVERLPRAFLDAAAREAERRQRVLPANASSTERIARARAQFELAMSQGDPRYAGYAQGSLAALDAAARSNPDSVPSAYWLVRGMLQQYLHAFDAALTSLRLAARDPDQAAESLAWQAAIHMVRADYGAARQACEALKPHSTALYVTGCLAYVDATTGRTAAAYAALSGALRQVTDAPAALLVWQQTRLAEMAVRLGQPKSAQAHFDAALKTGVTDQFLLGAYADFLIDNQKAAEALKLLAGWERSDVLLLRLALAARAVGDPRAVQWQAQLAERFSEAERRGDGLHEQEAARFELDIQQRPDRALAYAQRNYLSQREPRDAWVLLRAALAAKNPRAAQPALDWLNASGHEDPALKALAQALTASIPTGGTRP